MPAPRAAALLRFALCIGIVSALLDEVSRIQVLDALPEDVTALQVLCSDIGLQKACKAMDTTNRKSKDRLLLGDVKPSRNHGNARRAFRGLSSSSEASRSAQEHSESDAPTTRERGSFTTLEKCLPPGKLIFQHVMKTGGLSMDKFLSCACSDQPSGACTIRVKNNHWVDVIPRSFESECAPSICTTHFPATETAQVCGAEFAGATWFTTIREPVSRVWSFYNYLRRWYKPYNFLSLKDILQNYSKVDLNHGLPETEQCAHCAQQLSNAMAAHHYGGVARARHTLESMRVIIDLRRLEDFPRIATKYALFPELHSLSVSTKCAIEHTENSQAQYLLGRHPDPETAELIALHNIDDIMLYNFVKSLPQYES